MCIGVVFAADIQSHTDSHRDMNEVFTHQQCAQFSVIVAGTVDYGYNNAQSMQVWQLCLWLK